MFGFGILTGLIVLPLIGAGFILSLQGDDEATRRNARGSDKRETAGRKAVARFLETPRPFESD